MAWFKFRVFRISPQLSNIIKQLKEKGHGHDPDEGRCKIVSQTLERLLELVFVYDHPKAVTFQCKQRSRRIYA